MIRQSGFSLLSGLVIVMLVVCLGVMATRLFPVIYEYRIVRGVLVKLADAGEFRKSRLSEVQSAIQSNLSVNYVDAAVVDGITLERVGDTYVASFSYERIVPLAGNVSLLFRFGGSSGAAR